MNQWRLDGWFNPYKQHPYPPSFAYLSFNQEREAAFEAGAEAMLESLSNLAGDDGWITFEKEDGKVVAVYLEDEYHMED